MKKTIRLFASLALAGSAPAAVKPGAVDALFSPYSHANVPGASVIVIRDGKVLFRHAYGLADVEAHVAATTATNYRLASVTKQFTAMSILMLAERQRLSLDDDLTRFFPDYPAYGKQVTIRHLLTHTSGLRAYEDLIPAERTAQVHDIDVLDLLKRQTSTYFAPGSEWRYSNTGYAHLALIVEKASGMRFAAFLKKNIFDPLHMAGTVAYEEGVSTVRNRAYGYTERAGAFERTDQSVTSAVLGDGGIYSSVEDLFRWDQALYTTRLVRAETLQAAFTPALLTNGTKTAYGFGWEIGEYKGLKTVRHGGSTVGFRTHICRIPEKRFTVIVLVNRANARPEELADRIADLYLF
ncbi:MAG TPA: serine hydrolase domain-containing protein [Bryobacteraceae bacterium]|nr:serine hydrolase domain-containing protein [Bryobacteraceae bacterium]